MGIFETIGMAWVIFTAALAHVAIIYLAIVGLKQMVGKKPDARGGSKLQESFGLSITGREIR